MSANSNPKSQSNPHIISGRSTADTNNNTQTCYIGVAARNARCVRADVIADQAGTGTATSSTVQLKNTTTGDIIATLTTANGTSTDLAAGTPIAATISAAAATGSTRVNLTKADVRVGDALAILTTSVTGDVVKARTVIQALFVDSPVA